MAIYAAQGLYAAGCLYTTYFLCRQGLNLSLFSNPARVLTGEIKEFADTQAKKMGLEKEVVLIEGTGCYRAYGNTWCGKINIGVPLENTDNEAPNNEEVNCSFEWYDQYLITYVLAKIKANVHLIVPGATLAASLFTTFVLTVNYDLFTRYLGGLGVALITCRFSSRRAEKNADLEAMKHCSKEVNQAFLESLQKEKDGGYNPSLSQWIFEHSIDEEIGYVEAYLKSQEDGL